MKINFTVVLTIALLLLMVGAGVFSAVWGFSLGREALKGVTQPDFRPNGNFASNRPEGLAQNGTVQFVPESEILKQVESQIGVGSNEVVGDEL
ncbi:hypothetical protein [Baaleninema sp.]|uniref:hypothetical protein n=1 Tax=Baaleninema sp. TaxID=3101197 RepID=UPI003CFCDEB4